MVTMQLGNISDLNDLTSRVNRIMDQFMQKSFFRFKPCDRWQPDINLYETEHHYNVCIDLSGIDPKEVEIHLEKNKLHILGERKTPVPADGEAPRIHVMEIDHGPFYRAVMLPEDIEVNKIEAKYKQGLLWIEIPKKSKHISVIRGEK